MVEYSCSLCSFKSKIKTHYVRHTQTKKHKKAEIEREKKDPLRSPEKPREAPRNPEKPREAPCPINDDLTPENNWCEFCHTNISKKHLKRHYRVSCIKIPINLKNKYIEKYNKDKRVNKQTALITTNNINNISNINTNSNSNNINNNNNGTINNNIQQNNITVKINPLGQEDISFLTEKDKLEILAKRFMGVPELIKRIYGNPKNKNFFIPNVNKKVIAYLNEDNKLEYDNYCTILNQIIDENKDRFDDFYHELIDKINSKLIDRVAVVIQEHSNNEKINDKYMDDIKFNLISNSREIKELIENYMKEIKEKISLGLEDY